MSNDSCLKVVETLKIFIYKGKFQGSISTGDFGDATVTLPLRAKDYNLYSAKLCSKMQKDIS
ncbi:hypothetical protein C8R41DRAFT_843922 [Lentinula lateritia]|uniref:Uncharacterized protein n=1 Tax=Lentinula lateritia TaxID=40482 RepID=A0ABQ8V9P8_9AGAR|nr:hypothetical protein C8R41DRAFT_843922 [Lentinula lateritia]